MAASSGRRIDKALVLEVVLVLGLVTLAILLYWRPAAAGALAPTWWHAVALGGLFFAIVALHTWRARHRGRRALHEAIREDAAAAIEEERIEARTSPEGDLTETTVDPDASTGHGRPDVG